MKSIFHHDNVMDGTDDGIDGTDPAADAPGAMPAAMPVVTSPPAVTGGSTGAEFVASTMSGSVGMDPAPSTLTLAAPVSSASSDGGTEPTFLVSHAVASGLVINAKFDTSVTDLSATNPALEAQFKSAVQAAVQFYESQFTNPVTVNINFGWGEVAGAPVSGLGQNKTATFSHTYDQVATALKATDTTSAVQLAAAATLPATDPTGGATFAVTTAEARVLGLNLAFTGTDGSVGLNSSNQYSWSEDSIAAGTFDAVGALEHEISEVLGRIAHVGAGNTYLPLDLFRYTAADGGSNDPPGSAAGVRDEPFVSGFSANAFSYFSFDGKSVTNQFDIPSQVAAGNDPGDWAQTVTNDSFGYASEGQPIPVTATDLQVMNVLGFDLAPVACFAAGTRIATLDGEVPVEALQPGDTARLVLGGEACVTWVGHRRVDCSRHPAPELVWPVRIAAGAFESGLPRRDLYLSPDHAVYVGEALIPIRLLINRTTIRQIEVPSVDYYHVEVARHDVLLAEGLPAETYLDTGNRAAFQNGIGPVAMHPDFAGGQAARMAGSCAPLLIEPDAVEKVWRALADRSAVLGSRVPSPALEHDSGLYLLVGGRRIKPVLVRDGCHKFAVPAGDEPLFLVSRAARPCDVRPWVDDRRSLGVMVRRLTVRRGAEYHDVAVDDPVLERGWWDVEWQGGQPVRWTDGHAALPPIGSGVLEVELMGAMDYFADTGTRRLAAAG